MGIRNRRLQPKMLKNFEPGDVLREFQDKRLEPNLQMLEEARELYLGAVRLAVHQMGELAAADKKDDLAMLVEKQRPDFEKKLAMQLLQRAI